MSLITFPSGTFLVSSIQASWSIFHPDKPGHLFVLEPEEASCIDVYDPLSQYHIAICQGDKLQCQGWVNRHYQLPPENFFKLETDGKACCFHLRSRRLIIICLRDLPADGEEILFAILDRRHKAGLQTVFLGNAPAEAIRKWLGSRIVDRLRSGGVAFCYGEWASMRGATGDGAEF